MAAKGRKQTHLVNEYLESLEKGPCNFGFLQALRLIECLYPNSPRLGTSRRPGDDPIRIGQEPSMTFESASLSTFTPDHDGKPHKLMVRLLGLLGPNGPLPLHFTEYVQERRQKHRDFTLSRFLDTFHHRLLTLFYRAWAINEPTVSFDRPDEDYFANYVGSFAGIGMSALRERDEISDWTKFYHCGLLACGTKHPEGLGTIIEEYFNLPAHVNEFVGEWVPIPDRDVFRLGSDPSSGTMGVTAVLGKEVWCCQHKFRIVLGALGYEDFVSFLPNGRRINHLIALVRNYEGDESAWDLGLILKRNEVPALALNGQYRLGWTTWLGERLVNEDADDLVLNVFAFVNREKGKKPSE